MIKLKSNITTKTLIKLKFNFYISLVAFIFLINDLNAQHCEPIYESFLSSFSVRRSPDTLHEDTLDFNIEYTKTGGNPKESYQVYLLAYKYSDTEKIQNLTPQQVIEEKLATVVHTQLIQTKQSGNSRTYGIQWKLKQQEFVKKMLDDSLLDKNQIKGSGGWKRFEDEIRIAVFIPFLEDDKYSVIRGLPDYKHECNYGGEAALIFDSLPLILSIHSGIVQATKLPSGYYDIELNSRRPK